MNEPKKIILIVEDEPAYQHALAEKLGKEGFDILTAKNGEEGLAVALEKHPDLVLLDIVMQKMDGMTMMKKLRETNEWGKHVPIILLTNLNADDDKIMKAITDNEPAYYLVKADWAISDVVEKIRERLSREV